MRRRWKWQWDEEAGGRAWIAFFAWFVSGAVVFPVASVITDGRGGHLTLAGGIVLGIWLLPVEIPVVVGAACVAFWVLTRGVPAVAYVLLHPPIRRVTEPISEDLREREKAGQ